MTEEVKPLTPEEEREVRELDAAFDADNPSDFARPDWLVDLLFERRRLLATLDRERDAARAEVGCEHCGYVDGAVCGKHGPWADAAPAYRSHPDLNVEWLLHARKNVERENDRAFAFDRDVESLARWYDRLAAAQHPEPREAPSDLAVEHP